MNQRNVRSPRGEPPVVIVATSSSYFPMTRDQVPLWCCFGMCSMGNFKFMAAHSFYLGANPAVSEWHLDRNELILSFWKSGLKSRLVPNQLAEKLNKHCVLKCFLMSHLETKCRASDKSPEAADHCPLSNSGNSMAWKGLGGGKVVFERIKRLGTIPRGT